MGGRDRLKGVLANFREHVCGVRDADTLMSSFFEMLSAAVDLEAGGYILIRHGRCTAKVYSVKQMDKKALRDFERSLRDGARSRFNGIDLPHAEFAGLKQWCETARKSAGKSTEAEFIIDPLEGFSVFLKLRLKGKRKLGKGFEGMLDHLGLVLGGIGRALDAGEKALSDFIARMEDGVFIFDENGSLSTVNPAGGRLLPVLFGTDRQQPGEPVMAMEGSPAYGLSWSEGVARAMEVRTKDGRAFNLSSIELDSGIPSCARLLTARDVSDHEELRKKVESFSKLASIGEMAAGIAHEINNPLQTILVNMELLEGHLDEPGLKKAERVRSGILRISCVVKDLLSFARGGSASSGLFDINIAIEKSIELIGDQFRAAGVHLRCELSPHPIIVKYNRNLFQQVLINLLQNARDAIEEAGKGSVVTIRSLLGLEEKAIVEVSDDGPGIPLENRAKVFEPFFTTKSPGKGTGLGLAVSRRIVEDMGGEITVMSSCGGTTFSVCVPKYGPEIEERRKTRVREFDWHNLEGRSILVIDNEEGVLSAIREAAPVWVRIDTASSRAEATGKIANGGYDFLVLNDNMRMFDGEDRLLPLIEEQIKGGKVVFIRGHSGSGLYENNAGFLTKPFSIKEMISAICEAQVRQKGH